MSSSSGLPKICFNPDCKESKIDRLRKAWRLRTGEFAHLCDRCGNAYEEERFCEMFHINAAGWRSCETCRKPLHCGCIVSIHAFVLLDAGGVECMACVKKHSTMASNQSWPLGPLPLSERFKDNSVKSWNPVAVPNGVNGQWWNSVNARKVVTSQSELCSRMPYDIKRANRIDEPLPDEHPSISGLERVHEDSSERAVPSTLDLSVINRLCNRNAGADMAVAKNGSSKDEGTLDNRQSLCHLPGENGLVDARLGVIAEPGSHTSVPEVSIDVNSVSRMNIPLQSSSVKDPLILQHSGAIPYTPPSETIGSTSAFGTQPQRQTPPPPLSKQVHVDPQNGVESSVEAQMRNGKARTDARGRNQLLPRYWPKITDQELQQISTDDNVVITPLFEKTLSASDAGRIGRLVLPKKCAEAYFPTISQPEGVPLRVQDSKGKEWVFQFRFWPNNNSRMYVLEGVTPCIQNMLLQAGDTVTFSRMDPEGKLVMGFRKTSNASLPNQVLHINNQDTRKTKAGNGISKITEANFKEANTWSEVDKSGYIAKDALNAKSYLVSNKKKNSTLGLKSKRLQIENEDLMELQLTWEEAQGLFRPQPNHVPFLVVIENLEFEEYEDAPILGKPSTFTANNLGLSCSVDQEATEVQPQDMLNSSSTVVSKKTKYVKEDTDAGSEGLDTLANLAIMGEADARPSLAQPPTTKHPRHRPGCTCIVCIQPPSGKGPKHSETCTCNVCLTVRRRFRTLSERREKRLLENEFEFTRKKQQRLEVPEQVDEMPSDSNTRSGLDKELVVSGISADDYDPKKPSSPFKGGIDLNIQPERDDESSPLSGSGSMVKSMQDPPNLYHKQQKLASSENRDLDQLNTSVRRSERATDNLGSSVSHSSDHEKGDMDPATSATG